ncbi:MAG: site-2 protease family protein [Verrucomicrobia bacterium]|jgi:Zn-dependent protease|nr:site-2 protease family protein [Verrucomicrobiota bacterium]
MKWNIKLGRFFGIDVYVHVTFLIVLGFLTLASWMATRQLDAALQGAVFFAALFGCVLLHEFGHALMARRFGVGTKDITLLPIGGVARLERVPDKPAQEFWIAVAGPAVNVMIAGVLFVWLAFTQSLQAMLDLSATSGGFASRLLAANLFLVLFNLLPAFPMDGGRVLRSLLAMKLDYARATTIAGRLGQGMACVFGFVGLFGNPMLLLIALFVWIGAAQEMGAAQMKSSFAGASVRDAMLSDFRVLSPQDTLGDAAKLLLAGSQQDFPVVDHGRVVGILFHADCFQALRERGADVPAEAVMRTAFNTLEASASLEGAMAHVQAEHGLTMPVVDQGRFVGLLTPENLGEFFMIRRALANRPPPPRMPPVIGVPPAIAVPPILPSYRPSRSL